MKRTREDELFDEFDRLSEDDETEFSLMNLEHKYPESKYELDPENIKDWILRNFAPRGEFSQQPSIEILMRRKGEIEKMRKESKNEGHAQEEIEIYDAIIINLAQAIAEIKITVKTPPDTPDIALLIKSIKGINQDLREHYPQDKNSIDFIDGYIDGLMMGIPSA